MIGIGINENVVLEKVELLDKDGKLSVDFSLRAVGAGPTSAPNPLDFLDEQFDENGMLVTAGGKSNVVIKVWPINVPKAEDKDGKAKTIQARIEEANEASKEMQNLFTSFARCYLTTDKIKFDRFQGLNLTADSVQRLLDENVLTQITRNLAQQFIGMCAEYFNKDEYAVRLLLRRQSKAKPFPAFRDRMLSIFPFVESMQIPKTSSKIAFTRYETSNGLDNATPLTATDAPDATQPPVDMANLFGGTPGQSGELPSVS